MSTLRQRFQMGGRDALAAFAQPGLGSVGIKAPTSAPGLPSAPKVPSVPKMPALSSPGTSGGDSVGVAAAKMAFAVGMGASNSTSSIGAPAGEPVDAGRRQRSVVDRAFQRNEDDYATSSMPLPGDTVTP